MSERTIAIDRLSREKIGERVTIYRRGRTWWASYQLDRRQQRESLETTIVKEARRQAQRIENELQEGRRETPPVALRIADVIDEYLAHLTTEGRAPRTLEKYRAVLQRVLAVATARKAVHLAQLNLRFVDHYRSLRQREGRARKTIYTETVILRQLINFAKSRKLLARDPLEGLKLPKPRPTPQPCWSPEEVEQILAAAAPPQREMYLLLADTGMRCGELQWLTWDDVDLAANLVHIRPKEQWRPKSGDSRSVPMTDRVREMLEQKPRAGRWVFTPAGADRATAGRQISERRLLRSLKRTLKRIGLPSKGKLHTFRHSFISTALARGIPSATVRAWVGHVSDEILRQYTHVLDSQSQAAMRQFSRTESESEIAQI